MKEKFLLINLHTSNHGDEAAAKALLYNLNIQDKEISIIYNSECESGVPNFNINFHKSLLSSKLSLVSKVMIMLSFYISPKIIYLFFPHKLKVEYDMIKNSDKVISMPGGANLGLYGDWRYLWRIYIAQKLKKKVSIYSTSIGPFKNNEFKKITQKVLTNLDFLSLRDAQSFRYADEMGASYIKSIDTAFLVQSKIDNFNLKDYGIPFLENDFVVFVPNNLTIWHPTFRDYPPEKLRFFYIDIFNIIINKNLNIVFLPQLFGCGNDKKYFNEILLSMDKTSQKNCFVVDESFSSDIQQNIVSKSKFVVGARYHSIIFSINNNRPFICLSYENKMKNMLELLELQEYYVDLTVLPSENIQDKYLIKVESIMNDILNDTISISNTIPSSTAKECYKKFDDIFLDKSK